MNFRKFALKKINDIKIEAFYGLEKYIYGSKKNMNFLYSSKKIQPITTANIRLSFASSKLVVCQRHIFVKSLHAMFSSNW